ncbi:hypothetical protein [Mesorhizobium temperatum]|uniref:Uncharacterized protein n=1 Tax=Mesorhizobium temperatum TaxID=241416 RepID=A0A271LN66_9HYPH|nr:hypothetical protein [Mesorhizobium temperatum]PAQ09539.1 hypothetical protein CIT26_13530 [Mesorhizobium temperatum]
MSAAGDVTTGSTPDPVVEAAKWLATGSADRTKALVPQLQDKFGLTALQAVQAMRESRLVQARAH